MFLLYMAHTVSLTPELNATRRLRADCLNTGMPPVQTNARCETTDVRLQVLQRVSNAVHS